MGRRLRQVEIDRLRLARDRLPGFQRQLKLAFQRLPQRNRQRRDQLRRERWRLSPNLTWYPSEFSKIRLQYNYDNRADLGVDHSVWLQFEFLLGAHAAHKF